MPQPENQVKTSAEQYGPSDSEEARAFMETLSEHEQLAYLQGGEV
jgi:hypothetical protein